MSGLTEGPVARPSSTVVLVREAAGAPEIFMVRRHERSSFGAAFAFPGGVIDADDASHADRCDGRTSAQANGILRLHDGGLDFYVGAVRELFEETGVLLADVTQSPDKLAALRIRLNRHSLAWSDFLRDSGARMLCDRLHYFSHWITPETMQKRYTTRFFVAKLPGGQVAQHDGGELTDSRWLTAQEALRAAADGCMKLHYPTVRTLQSLAAHENVVSLVEWACVREAAGVEAIQPVLPSAMA